MELTAEQKLYLASSADFQHIVENDDVLKELDASRIDYENERFILFEALGGVVKLFGGELSPITPAIWSFLWLLRSPLCTGKVPDLADIAIVLYVLRHPLDDINLDTLREDALAYGEKNDLREETSVEFWREFVKIVDRTFSPLSMLPHAKSTNEPIFDVDWLLSVCSVVSEEAGITLQEAALHFPLSSAFGLMVIRARRANPGNAYGKHTPEWISRATLIRMRELQEEFLTNNLLATEPEKV